eukprot:11218024-Lingulodinium_polyedra.AAC.1
MGGTLKVVRWCAVCAAEAHGENYVEDGRITKRSKRKAEQSNGGVRGRNQRHAIEAFQKQADRITAKEGRGRIDTA